MGAAAGDFDGDGDLDIFKTNFSNDTHTLYLNEGDGMFTDETITAGLGVNTRFLGWGTSFIDVDQDGWKDLFVANGHVYPEVDDADIGESFRQRRLLYWNRGDGEFYDMSEDAGPGISAKHSSRGMATGDLDNDGDLEIVVVNMHEPPSLLKNFAPKGGALLVEVLTKSGRAAIGARIAVRSGGRTQIDEVRSGGNHISQSDFRLHFGLGNQPSAFVEVRWPSGAVESYQNIEANRRLIIQEGKGLVEKRKFGSPARARNNGPVAPSP